MSFANWIKNIFTYSLSVQSKADLPDDLKRYLSESEISEINALEPAAKEAFLPKLGEYIRRLVKHAFEDTVNNLYTFMIDPETLVTDTTLGRLLYGG